MINVLDGPGPRLTCLPMMTSLALVLRATVNTNRSTTSRLGSRFNRSTLLSGQTDPRSQFRYGAVTVGSVDLTPDSHPIDIDGRPQERIWMFGVLTEGFRHFNHYIPSPNSRIRAFEDLGACIAEILAG